MTVTLEDARAITRAAMPAGGELADIAFADDTYWLVPVYVPAGQEEPDSPVIVVRKETGAVELLLPHIPPVSEMPELA